MEAPDRIHPRTPGRIKVMQSNKDVQRHVLYVGASQYSGSTLASFLLNLHPRITTAGHTMGWHFDADEDFPCSCGRTLRACPYYKHIARAYDEAGLQFDVREFKTGHRLVANERLNRYLTASLPVIAISRLERIRDRLVGRIPPWRRRLEEHDAANLTFVRAAMDYSNADVYVDNSHDPYRFRLLRRIHGLRLSGLHLVRDPRGVVLSCMKHAGWSAGLSMRLWLRRQRDIQRIFSESGCDWLAIRYEDLCLEVDESLARIHDFLGLDFEPFSGTFDTVEHHILGNAMRLRGGEIRLDEKWRHELDNRSREHVESELETFQKEHGGTSFGELLGRYIEAGSGPWD